MMPDLGNIPCLLTTETGLVKISIPWWLLIKAHQMGEGKEFPGFQVKKERRTVVAKDILVPLEFFKETLDTPLH